MRNGVGCPENERSLIRDNYILTFELTKSGIYHEGRRWNEASIFDSSFLLHFFKGTTQKFYNGILFCFLSNSYLSPSFFFNWRWSVRIWFIFFLINNIPSFIVYYFTKYYFSRNKTAHTFAICIFIVHSLIFSMWMGSNASFFFFFLFWSLNFFLLWLDPSLTRLKARDFNFVKRGKNWKTPIKWISKLIQNLNFDLLTFQLTLFFFKKKTFDSKL